MNDLFFALGTGNFEVVLPYFLWFIIFQSVFGFIGRSIMENKGRSAITGFILGFICNIPGIIVCLAYPESDECRLDRIQKLQRSFPPIPVPPTTDGYCKSCGTALIPGAAFCPSCGTKV